MIDPKKLADDFKEALILLEACTGCDLYYDAYSSLTLDPEDKRSVMDFVEEFLKKHQQPHAVPSQQA